MSVKAVRAKLERHATHIGKKVDLGNVLPSILKSINTTPVHRTNFTPVESNQLKNSGKVFQLKYGKYLEKREKMKNKFQVGQQVRIAIPDGDKNKFLKKSKAGFSSEIFLVDSVRDTIPPSYVIKDQDGNFLPGYFRQEFLMNVGE